MVRREIAPTSQALQVAFSRLFREPMLSESTSFGSRWGIYEMGSSRSVLGSSYPGSCIELTRWARKAGYPSSWPRSQDHYILGRWIDIRSAASNSFYGNDGERKFVCCWHTQPRPSLCTYSPAFGEEEFCELRLYGVLRSPRSPGPTPMTV